MPRINFIVRALTWPPMTGETANAHCAPVLRPVPMPVPIPDVEQGLKNDGDQIPFEQTAVVWPVGKPDVQVKVAEVPLENGPKVLPVE